MKARRGDLIVLEKTSSYTTTSDGYHERTEYEVGVVTSITREGVAKAVRSRYGDNTPIANIHRVGRTFIVPAGDIDVEAAATAAWANEWRPGYPGKPFDSLAEVKAVLVAHKVDVAA